MLVITKEYQAFSMRLAGFLMQKGFVLKHMRKDEKSNRSIFIFNDSQPLQLAIKEYLKN